MSENRICFVRNLAQKVLMDFELKGQMSDGHWENARQDWRVWCDTKFLVSIDDRLGTIGISDWKKRTARYNLAAKDLLDVVGDRMMASVRVCQRFPRLVNHQSAAEHCAEAALNNESYDWDWAKEYLSTVEKVIGKENMEEFNRVAKDTSLYTMKQMRKDLKDLKEIMKITLE